MITKQGMDQQVTEFGPRLRDVWRRRNPQLTYEQMALELGISRNRVEALVAHMRLNKLEPRPHTPRTRQATGNCSRTLSKPRATLKRAIRTAPIAKFSDGTPVALMARMMAGK